MTQRLERIYGITLLVILAGIVVHAPLSVSLGVVFPDYLLLIKSWKEILMLALIPLACFVIARRKLGRELSRDWIIRLITAYAALHIILLGVFWRGSEVALAGLAIDLRYLLFFGLVYVAVRAMPSLRRYFVIIATIGAAVVVGFATMQLFLPPDILTHIGYSKETITPYLTVDKNPEYIRVNSTLRGPNPLGAYAGMVVAMLTAVWARGKLAITDLRVCIGAALLAASAITALWISYSRSALVAGVIGVVIVLGLAVRKKVSRRAWIATAIVIFALLGGLAAARDTSFVSNVILHENPSGGSDISSNEGHAESLDYGLRQMINEPLGSGVGSTGSASLLGNVPIVVENQYLFIAHEVGWLGLWLFLALFVMVMKRLYQRRADWMALGLFASGVGLALIGVLLPVWADDTVSIVWWGLVAVVLAGGKYGRKSAKQKTA